MILYIIEKKEKVWMPISHIINTSDSAYYYDLMIIRTSFTSKKFAEAQLGTFKINDPKAKFRITEWERRK